MKKWSLKEVQKIGLASWGNASAAVEWLFEGIKVGEGVSVEKKDWTRKTHPLSVMRHRARWKKTSPVYGMGFSGRKLKGGVGDWDEYLIIRVK